MLLKLVELPQLLAEAGAVVQRAAEALLRAEYQLGCCIIA